MDSERFFINIKSLFFWKRKLKNIFFQKTQNPSKKKTKANFRIIEVNCGEIQGQFVISTLKTDIEIQSQN